MKLHDHRLLKTLASAGAALFALCATTLEASAGAVGGHVDITGSMLNVGGAPARFFCATGVTVPHPRRTAEGDGEAGETAWNEAAEEAMRMVDERPRAILADLAPAMVAGPIVRSASGAFEGREPGGLRQRLARAFGRS